MRKEFHRCLWSWSLPIQKRVVWLVKRLVHEKRWHSKIEVGFVDQFVEFDTEPTKQPEVVKDIPNLVDAKMDIGFHDHLVESNMETTEHLVMNDPVAVGGELCIAEHGLVCIDGDLHVGADVEFFVVDVGFVATGVDSLVADVNEALSMKHCVQFVPKSEHADWMIEIFVFDSVIQMWLICILLFLSLLEWKPLVKMKMVGDLYLDIKVWDTLFYLPGESDAGASRFCLVTTWSLGLGFWSLEIWCLL